MEQQEYLHTNFEHEIGYDGDSGDSVAIFLYFYSPQIYRTYLQV